jgi:large subunit ribosomal protein L3
MTFAIGKKIGMTRIFDQDGKSIAVSIVKVETNLVVDIKNIENNRKKVQLATIKCKKLNKPEAGHLKRSTKELYRVIREFESPDKEYKVGDQITVDDFQKDSKVAITGVSKGKGFAGVIKRHNFSRGPETHGSDHHRKPGSIGSMFPQHVLRGQKMPGRMGSDQVTVKNLTICDTDKNSEVLLISGAIPGNRGSIVTIKA